MYVPVGKEMAGSIVHHNWLHDISGIGFRVDIQGRGITVQHNLVWAVTVGCKLQGYQLAAYNNTVLTPKSIPLLEHDLQGNKLANAPQTLKDRRFRCVWQTDAALSFVERHAREPFFLYLAYFTPHVPLESPEPWFSQTPEHLPKERRQTLAMIAAMDDGIGRLRATLRDVGIEKNTLIFFISDNGAPLSRGAWNGSLNLPLTGEKGMLIRLVCRRT